MNGSSKEAEDAEDGCGESQHSKRRRKQISSQRSEFHQRIGRTVARHLYRPVVVACGAIVPVVHHSLVIVGAAS